MTLRVERYTAALSGDWHDVLRSAKNGVFLFERDYLEYHADRFVDFSFVAYDDDGPVALCPATLGVCGEVVSHAGLTFGGLVLRKDLRSEVAIAVVHAVLDAARDAGGTTIRVRPVPELFCSRSSGELTFALKQRGIDLEKQALSSVVDLDRSTGPSKGKIRDALRAEKLGSHLGQPSVAEFHDLLSAVLLARHDARPAHSREELVGLQRRFPENMLSRGAFLDGALVAGTLVFVYGDVWHTQYLATSEEGRRTNALDQVILSAMAEAKAAGARAFSFGTSMSGDAINFGLLRQKESFGARSIVLETWSGPL